MGLDNYPLVVYKNHLECSRMFVMLIETNYIIEKVWDRHTDIYTGAFVIQILLFQI